MRVFGRVRSILALMAGLPETPVSGNVTLMLRAVDRGDPQAADRLMPLVYDELRRLAQTMMAKELPGQTLQATALVSEAYLRLVGSGAATWQDRRHFFNAAAMAMRRALIDRARRYSAEKRGGDAERIDMDMVNVPVTSDFPLDQMEAVGAALDALAAHNARWAEIVQLRFFAGLTIEQTAEALGIAATTVKDDWSFARAWLRWKLKQRSAVV